LLLKPSRDRTFLRLPGYTQASFLTMTPLQYTYCMKLPRDLYCTPQFLCTPGSVLHPYPCVCVVGDIAVATTLPSSHSVQCVNIIIHYFTTSTAEGAQTGGESCVM